MSPRKIAESPPLGDYEVATDLRRAIIQAVLRKRGWSSADLARTMTVAEFAAALVPIAGLQSHTLRGEMP